MRSIDEATQGESELPLENVTFYHKAFLKPCENVEKSCYTSFDKQSAVGEEGNLQ